MTTPPFGEMEVIQEKSGDETPECANLDYHNQNQSKTELVELRKMAKDQYIGDSFRKRSANAITWSPR